MTERLQLVVADRAQRREFAGVMMDAFATEGIHTHMFDFARAGTRPALERAALVEVEWYAEGSDYILVARLDGRVVGGAMVGGNGPRRTRTRIVLGIRWLIAAAPLVWSVRWRRLLSLHRATRLSRPIVGAYYTLAALAVAPQYQRRGIGLELLRAVHAASEHDAAVLGVYLVTGEEKNRRMYERAGYMMLEQRRTGGLTVYHMFRSNGGRILSGGREAE